MSDTSLLASCMSTPPSSRLVGHALLGSDLVLGDTGRALHGPVEPGADGAYVSVEQQPDGSSVIGVDHTGYAKVYLYRHGREWALGTSMMELADHAAAQGWRLTIDRTALSSFLLRPKTIGLQLASAQTPFREIRLLAPTERAVVRRGRGRSLVATHHVPTQVSGDYASALTLALNEMVGRMGSLMESGLTVRSAVTGGRDSRCVLAALLAAHGPDPRPIGQRVQFYCGEPAVKDFEVASALSETYQLDLNGQPDRLSHRIDPEAGFRLWRRHDMGVNNALWPFSMYRGAVSLSGVGGEEHRLVYRRPTMEDQLREARGEHLTDDQMDGLVATMEESLAEIPGDADRRITHHRVFRNRFHGGRMPMRSLMLSPLDSLAFHTASAHLPAEDLENAQFHADIVLNLAPLLATRPHDLPSKRITRENEARLTRVDVDPSRMTGRVLGEQQPAPPLAPPGVRTLDPYREAFAAAAPAVQDSGLVPDAVVQQARGLLEQAGPHALTHANHGGPLAITLLTGELLRLENSTHRPSSGPVRRTVGGSLRRAASGVARTVFPAARRTDS